MGIQTMQYQVPVSYQYTVYVSGARTLFNTLLPSVVRTSRYAREAWVQVQVLYLHRAPAAASAALKLYEYTRVPM